ncbi:MAG: AAA family ATPase [Streptomyces sp.]|nr:AAA family ATPase [Streptomyces sp.]
MGGSAPRRESPLPVETTSFVDRRAELAEGRELLARARLVTLTGPGGVGKTRLAVRIAARVARAFPDGVRFVPLSGLHDPHLVPHAVADALGLHDHSSRPPLDALVERVRDRRLLLVVDNCEHLPDACAGLAAALLHGTTGIRLLATSRHRLGLTEEHLMDVRPLRVPDPDAGLTPADDTSPALALFADRAAAVVPGFRLTDGNRAAVARLCARLDGLPLAIELAAVRMRVLGVEQLLARLDDRYRLLTTGSRAVLPRHQTLRAAVDWSHDLCTETERVVWARLSALAGTFDLEAAEAVAADGEHIRPHDVLEAVAGLMDKSILTRQPPEEAGTGPLGAGAGGGVVAGCGADEGPGAGCWAGAGPGGCRGEGPVTGCGVGADPGGRVGLPGAGVPRRSGGRVGARVAGGGAGAQGVSAAAVRYRLLDTLRHYGLEKLRERPGEEAAVRRRGRDWVVGRVAGCEGAWFGPGQRGIVARLRADRDSLRAALDFSLRTPGEALTGLRLAGDLWFYWHACGAPREGRHWIDRALDANPEDTRERARGLWVSGLLAAVTQDLALGRRRAEQARALALRLGDEAEAAHAGYVVGVIQLFGDDLTGALDHFRSGVARGPLPGQHLSLVALDRVELACALSFLGRPDEAIAVCEETRGLCEAHGEEWVLSYVLRMLALARKVKGERGPAERHARDALRLKLAVHDVIGIGLTLDLLAEIASYGTRAELERAAVLLGAADRVWADIDRGRWGSAALAGARQGSEDRSRGALGDDTYRRRYDHGAGLALTEAAGYALDRPDSPRRDDGGGRTTGTPLTRRERQVAELVAEGLGNQQIADRLVIARRTAEGHVERILSKLGFSNRSQIAAWVTARR